MGGEISEWFDHELKSTDEFLIEAISSAKVVKIKLFGKQYQDFRTLSSKQIKSIQRTYEYYKALGGNLE